MYSKRLSQIDALANGIISIASGTPAALNPTNHAVQVGDGTTLTSVAVGSTGTVLIGSTGADPAFGSSINGDITVTSSTSGATRTLLAESTSNANNSSAVLQARVAGALAGDPRLLLSINGATDWSLKSNNIGNQQFVISHSTLGTSSQYMLIDTTGNVTRPSSSNVLVYNNAGVTNATGDGTTATLVLDTEVTDRNGNFASNTFTAPVTTSYQVNITVCLSGLTASHTGSVMTLVTSNRNWQTWATNIGAMRDSGNNALFSYSAQVDMDANDTLTATILVNGGAKVVGYFGVFSSTIPRTFMSVSIV